MTCWFVRSKVDWWFEPFERVLTILLSDFENHNPFIIKFISESPVSRAQRFTDDYIVLKSKSSDTFDRS